MIEKNGQKLLEVGALSVGFAGKSGARKVVHSVSFEIAQGEILALVGESGSGKTLTALSLMQLLPYPQAFHDSGQIRFGGHDIMTLPHAQLRQIRGRDISMIFQEPMTALNPLHTIGKQLAEAITLHRTLSKDEIQQEIKSLLQEVELDILLDRLDAYPHELSGGQRQRIMIAMALANRPSLLIADEPTTALDVTVANQILDLLLSLKKNRNMSILLITHDLHLVRRFADRVAVMKDGHIVEQGNVETLFKTASHPYTQMLLSTAPKGKAVPLQNNAKAMMEVEGLQVKFPLRKGIMMRIYDYVRAVTDIDFSLKQGETLGIIGESGSGKSTLAAGILRLIEADGTVSMEGINLLTLSKQAMRARRADLQMVFQDPFASLNPRMSVLSLLEEGLIAHKIGGNKAEREQRIIEALHVVGIDAEMRFRYPHEFSGGQRQRIAIARALVLKPKLIIFDEPTSALDVSVQAQIIDLLRKLQTESGISYIFISHDVNVVRAISHRILVLKGGKIIERGDTESIINQPEHEYTKSLIKAAFA